MPMNNFLNPLIFKGEERMIARSLGDNQRLSRLRVLSNG